MENHQKTKIGEFLFERKGKYNPDDETLFNLKKIIKIDFSKGKIHLSEYKQTKTKQIIVYPDDLVFSGLNIEKGAISINDTETQLVVSANYSTCRIDYSVITKEYLSRYLHSPQFKKLLKENLKKDYGFTRPKHLLPLEISLPIIEDQRKIVSHLKSIENEDDELKQEINNQQILLKKLRQQVLQGAIEGKLTEDWRKKNTNVEPASELLKRIKAEKDQLIKEKKIKKQKLLPLIAEEEKPFEIPEIWEWCRLDELIYESPKNGFSPKAVNYETNVKNLKLGATTKGYFDETEYKYVDIVVEQDSFLWLKSRDLLIQRGNSIDFVGISAIFNCDKKFIYPDLMMKLQPSQFISEIFLHNVLISNYARNYYRDNASGAQKSMPKINQGIVSKTLIPLPSLSEQLAIVEKVEGLLAVCDEMGKEINKNKKYSEQLMQAVLKEAFTKD